MENFHFIPFNYETIIYSAFTSIHIYYVLYEMIGNMWKEDHAGALCNYSTNFERLLYYYRIFFTYHFLFSLRYFGFVLFIALCSHNFSVCLLSKKYMWAALLQTTQYPFAWSLLVGAHQIKNVAFSINFCEKMTFLTDGVVAARKEGKVKGSQKSTVFLLYTEKIMYIWSAQ